MKKVICSIFILVMVLVTFQEVNATEEIVADIAEERIIKNAFQEENIFNEENDSNIGISTISTDIYEGKKLENKDRYSKSEVYIQKDGKNYIYIAESYGIGRICLETGEYKSVYSISGHTMKQNYYVDGQIIYYAYYLNSQTEKLTITGFDAQTESVVYENNFNIPSSQYEKQFIVDKNKNIFIVYNHGNSSSELTIESYDKNGSLIDSYTKSYYISPMYVTINLTGIKSDGSMLFLSILNNGSYGETYNDYMIKIQNGKFIEKKVYLIREYGGMIIKFLDKEETRAYTQYGEFYEIDYNANTQSGIDFIDRKNLNYNGKYISTSQLYSNDDTFIYLGGKDGHLYIFNYRDFRVERHMSIGDNKTILGVYKISSDEFWIEYYNVSNGGIYAVKINLSNFDEIKQDVILQDHTSLSHTKRDILNKYNESKIVNNTDDLYEIVPSITSPYVAGELKEQVKKDTLNQVNLFRWVSGLNNVTQNDAYMEYSQKGAVIQAINNELSHYPKRPSGMDNDFFTKAYKANSAGIGNSADVSYGERIADSIKGFIDDTTNVEKNVGHRLSLLDDKAEKISFGYANRFSTINVFNSASVDNPDIYYSWPSPGYFPIELIDYDAMWSVGIGSGTAAEPYYITTPRYIVLKANGKEYTSAGDDRDFNLYYDNYYFFDIPTELKNYLSDEENQDCKTVEIEVHGISDGFGNTYILSYPVKFFSLDKVLINISLPSNLNMTIGESKKLNVTTSPADIVLDEPIKWNSDSTNVSVTQDGTLTANNIGEATITAEVDEIKATCKVNVTEKPMYKLGDVNEDGMITSQDARMILEYTVGIIDTFTNAQKLAADINKNKAITSEDARMILEYTVGIIDF